MHFKFQIFYFAFFNIPGDYGHTKYFVSASVDLPGFDKSENVEFNVNRYRFDKLEIVFYE